MTDGAPRTTPNGDASRAGLRLSFGTLVASAALAGAALIVGCGSGSGPTDSQKAADEAVQSGLNSLVTAPGGPPGAIATIQRGSSTVVLSAGRAATSAPAPPAPTDHMRIASISKAFSGAVALNLVEHRDLSLDDTIAQRISGLPKAWGQVTLRQMLNHTSGLPDYTTSAGFSRQIQTDPAGYVPPRVWTWDAPSGGAFANINRPTSGATHDKELPVGRHPLQLYSLASPNGVKVTIMLEELLAAGHTGAEYDAWLIRINEGKPIRAEGALVSNQQGQ